LGHGGSDGSGIRLGLKAKKQAAQCSLNEKRMARLDPAGLIAKNQPDTFRGRANLLA
jgi:hypothetical protein